MLNADLENLHSLLPVEVVVADEGGDASLEIMKPVLVMTAVTSLPSVPVTFIYNPYTMLLEFISKDHLKDMLNQLRPFAKEACLPTLTITYSQPCETKRLSSQRQKRLYEN